MSPGIKQASRDQIVALQTLFAAWHSRLLTDEVDVRRARLEWASEQLAHKICSFSDLTADEARQLIDKLKSSLGQELGQQPQPWRRVPERDAARRAGTAGRKSVRSDVIQLAGVDDLARIDEGLQRIGWTRERFDAWLKSDSSPISKREDGAIRTLADANKVWWALKAMLIRAGAWKQQKVS